MGVDTPFAERIRQLESEVSKLQEEKKYYQGRFIDARRALEISHRRVMEWVEKESWAARQEFRSRVCMIVTTAVFGALVTALAIDYSHKESDPQAEVLLRGSSQK